MWSYFIWVKFAKSTEWLASVRCEVLETDDIDELYEIEREVDGR